MNPILYYAFLDLRWVRKRALATLQFPFFFFFLQIWRLDFEDMFSLSVNKAPSLAKYNE